MLKQKIYILALKIMSYKTLPSFLSTKTTTQYYNDTKSYYPYNSDILGFVDQIVDKINSKHPKKDSHCNTCNSLQ